MLNQDHHHSPCLTKECKNNWKALRNYSTCCERLIRRMKDELTKKKLTHSNDIDYKMKGYITMPTMLSELDEMSDCVIQGFSSFFPHGPIK